MLTLQRTIQSDLIPRKAKDNNRNISGTITLRGKLDGIYAIADLACCVVLSPKAFDAQCMALCAELEELDNYLHEIYDRYHKELPLELHEMGTVILGDEIIKIRNKVNNVCERSRCSADRQAVDSLKQQTETTCKMMSTLATWLIFGVEKNALLMSEYGKNMRYAYVSNRFLSDMQMNPETLLSSDDRNKIFKRTDEIKKTVIRMADDVMDDKGRSVRYDTLGRYLWQTRNSEGCGDPRKSILFLIQTYDLYMAKLGIPFDYRNASLKKIKETNNIDDVRNRVENKIKEVKEIILGNCDCYFINSTWKERVGNLLDEMIDVKFKDLVHDSLLSDRYFKFTHQIVGVLMDRNIITDCTCEEVVRSMKLFNTKTGKPSVDSRIRYMRHQEDGAEIINWMNAKITELNDGKWVVAS